MHVFETVVRLGLTDAAGVVFFARYFDMAHRAFEDLLDALGHPLPADLAHAAVGFPLVHAEADYRAPLRLGDRLAIHVTTDNVSHRSFVLDYALVRDAETVATVRTVHAAIDVERLQAVDIPATLRTGLEALRP